MAAKSALNRIEPELESSPTNFTRPWTAQGRPVLVIVRSISQILSDKLFCVWKALPKSI